MKQRAQVLITLIYACLRILAAKASNEHVVIHPDGTMEISSDSGTAEEKEECEGCFIQNETWEEDDEDWPEDYVYDWNPEDDYEEIFDGLDCPDILFTAPRTIPTPETWKLLRETYRQVLGDQASISEDQITGNAFQVPIEVRHADGKGRGVFAKEDIPGGTLIYKQHTYTAMFWTGESFREYLKRLPEDLACDVLLWCYVEYRDEKSKDEMILAFDIDEGSFTNGAVYRSEVNVDMDYVATRDIKAGEELIESYDDFSLKEGFDYFGL